MNKFIKTMFVIVTCLVGITYVYADECDPPKTEVADNYEENIECREDGPTVIKFNYPEDESVQIKSFENEYCKVICKESINLAFNGITSVYAGKGFSYPLNMSATRSCQAEYKNIESFDKLFREMIDSYLVLYGYQKDGIPEADIDGDGKKNEIDYLFVKQKINSLYTLKDLNGKSKKVLDYNNDGVIDESATDTLLQVINDMNNMKNSCDSWGTTEESKYKLEPEVSLEITTSTNSKDIKYEYLEKTEPLNVKSMNESKYVSCSLVMSETTKLPSCKGETSITGWSYISNISGQYNMPECEIELYTGKVIYKGQTSSKPTCKAGNKFFVNFKELSKPSDIDDKIDKGYPLRLTVKKIGNNIDYSGSKNMSLNVGCSYKVLNLASPTKLDFVSKTLGSSITIGNGLSTFDYRTISLTNPFPERNPLSNWNGFIKVKVNGKDTLVPLKDYYITSSADKIRERNLYTIDFNRNTISAIKDYNKSNQYGIFNLNPQNEKSYFIENNKVIKRGN